MLSNRRIQVTELEFLNSSPVDIQQIPIIRGSGSSVVRTRNEARTIKMKGGVTPTTYGGVDADQILYLTSDINQIFNQQNSYLRTVPKSKVTLLDDCQSINGWTASDDATNVTLDTENFEWESASVAFDVDVSVSGNNYATLTKTLTTPINLSAKTDTGNFEYSIYLQDAYYVSSIDVRIGNDSSNYYSTTFITNYEGKAFGNGVNYLSVAWGNEVQGRVINETGTVNDSVLDYLFVRINYAASASDFKGRLNFIAHVEEDFVRNYPCYSQGGVNWDPIWFKQTDNMPNEFEVTLLNNTGYGIATHDIQLFNVTGITSVSSTQTVDLKGNLEPQIANTFTLNTVTNLTDLRYSNLNKNELIRWTNTWVASDVVKFDKLNTIVTRNSIAQDFSGKLPGAVVGKNRLQMSIVTGASTLITVNTGLTERYCDSFSISGFGISSRSYAQSFTCTSTSQLTDLTIYGRGVDTTTPVYISIESNSAGSPSGIVLWSGYFTPNSTASITANTISGINLAITNTTVYWCVLKTPSITNLGLVTFASNRFYWAISNVAYSGGEAKNNFSSAPSYTATSDDQQFQITQTPTPSTNIDWTATYKPLYL
jgi:hypothetical protein